VQLTGIDTSVLNPQVIEYITNLETQIAILKEQINILTLRRFGRSSEQYDIKQQPLFPSEAEQENLPKDCNKEDKEKQAIKSYSRNKPGRKPLNPNLRREVDTKDLSAQEKICSCCGYELIKIGEEKSERLEYVPAEIYVKLTIRPKYICGNCEGKENEDSPAVKIKPPEPQIIPRSIAGASLLSNIMIQKFQDHVPFHRQETIFKRIGVEISKQDMSNWQQHIYRFLAPLFLLLGKVLISSNIIRMDETTSQVMGSEEKSDTKKSYIWLMRGGPPEIPVVIYAYRPTREAKNVIELLKGFSGYLQTDGYEGYDAAVKELCGIIHVGCFAHSRRKFFEAAKAVKTPQSAEVGLSYIRKLYEIERTLREMNLDDNKFLEERKEKAGVILSEFHEWLNKRNNEVLPTSALGKAVAYTLRQWDKLIKYLENPYLTPDNNIAENCIRPYVVGRKNYMFHKSPEGAKSACGMYTLIETAKQNGVDPFRYLDELFKKAPYLSSPKEWEELLPWNIFKSKTIDHIKYTTD
jgi:transposase